MGNGPTKTRKITRQHLDNVCAGIITKVGRPIDYIGCRLVCWEIRQNRIYMWEIEKLLKVPKLHKWLENGSYAIHGKTFLQYLKSLTEQHRLPDRYICFSDQHQENTHKRPVSCKIDGSKHLLWAFPSETIKCFMNSVIHIYGRRDQPYLIIADGEVIDPKHQCSVLCGSVLCEFITVQGYQRFRSQSIQCSTSLFSSLLSLIESYLPILPMHA